MWRAVFYVVLCAGCASAPGPVFNDLQYLRFGVDPRAEAGSLVESYAAKSEPLAQRIVGHDFTALGFMDRERRYTRVRVVTGRGITLALDPEAGWPLPAARRYALLPAPIADTQDADGDGFEEVFVESRRNSERCILVYRVRDVGFVDPVPIDHDLLGSERCPQEVDDVDGDGRAELVVPVALDFALAEPPQIRVVLWAEKHRYVLHDTHSRAVRLLAQEAASRELALDHARGSHDVASVLRLAIELTALAQLSQRSTADQLARFDGVIEGQPLDARQRTWVAAARARITQAWHADSPMISPDSALASAERDPELGDGVMIISAREEPAQPAVRGRRTRQTAGSRTSSAAERSTGERSRKRGHGKAARTPKPRPAKSMLGKPRVTH